MLIWRFFVIVFGFGCACLAAAATLIIGAIATANLEPPFDQPEIATLWMVTLVTSFAIAFFAFFPALIAILLAENFAWRSVLFYALAGAAIGLFFGFALPTDAPGPFYIARSTELIAGAGIAAGLVYWLIAGRNAGAWRLPGISDQKSGISPR
jgi:hypothetical protein